MDILTEARKDAKMIVSNGGGFELPCIFDNQSGTIINTFGLFVRRTDTLEYEDGSKTHSPFSSVSTDIDKFNFSEKYISLKTWTVEVEGNVYEILESLPNRTLGIIQCNLKDV